MAKAKQNPPVASETPQTDPPATDPAAELRHYMQVFGNEDGARYFADGMDINAAAIQHIEVLRQRMTAIETDAQARVAAAEARAADALNRLASMNTGEATAIDVGRPPARGDRPGGWEGLFKQADAPPTDQPSRRKKGA